VPRSKKGVRKIQVTLKSRHLVNGQAYGPGQVFVLPDLAAYFQHVESRQEAKEQSLMTERAFIIQGQRKRQVAPGRFNEILGGIAPETI